MPRFYFQPLSFVLLAALTITVFLTGYLATIRSKRADLRILFTYMIAYTAFLTIGLLIYTVMTEWRAYLIPLLFVGIAVTVTGFVHFAYAFLSNPFRREMRVVLTVLVGGTLAYTAHVVAQIVTNGQALDVNVTIVPGAAMLVDAWVFILLVRKALHLERADRGEASAEHALPASAEGGSRPGWLRAVELLRHATTNDARAHRALLAVSATHIALRIEAALWAIGYIPFSLHVTLFYSIELVFVCMLIWVYVSYSPQPTTLRVKLAGLTLATTLLFLGIGGAYSYSTEHLFALGKGLLPDYRAMRFDPVQGGGYRATVVASLPDDTAAMTELMPPVKGQPRPGSIAVALPFRFPFAGRWWDSAHVSRFGTVCFGADFEPTLSSDFHSLYLRLSAPKITPMLYGSTERLFGDRVFCAGDRRRAVITWQRVRMSNSLYPGGISKPGTFRLILYADGAVQWEYPDANIHGLAELSSGAPTGVKRVAPGATVNASEAFRTDYLMQYRTLVHHAMLPMLYLILAAALFIVVFLPWLYGASLVKPLAVLLEGVRRVNTGRLDVRLPVHSSDELGSLSTSFNLMTSSLQQSERALKDYAETLEQKVESRTAELHRSLHRLQETQAQLIQAEKMASLGQLTAGIAHELRNPLNFITNFSTLSKNLLDELPDASTAEERAEILAEIEINLRRIEEHGRRADAIIRSMMLHARSDGAQRQSSDINLLLDEAVNRSYHSLKAAGDQLDVRLERRLLPELPRIAVAPQEISRVFLNIVQNGLYALGRKALSLSSQATDAPFEEQAVFAPTLSVSTDVAQTHVVIRIRDNGTGIPSGIREKIFQPFFTTKPAGEGTGLGLSIGYDIITGHGGTVAVESLQGQYTEFVITLPLDEQPGASTEQNQDG
jgi:signal transduction histidine kinase